MRVYVKKYDEPLAVLFGRGTLVVEDGGLARQIGRILKEMGLRQNVLIGWDRELKRTIIHARGVRMKGRKKRGNGSIFDLELVVAEEQRELRRTKQLMARIQRAFGEDTLKLWREERNP